MDRDDGALAMSRRIIVTGCASGIGAALADMLRKAGDEVIGLDRTAGDIVCDLSDRAAVVRAAGQIAVPIDGIAHVAGLPGTAAIDAIFAVNTSAPRQLTELLGGSLRKGATVVAVSSVTAARCPLGKKEKDALLAVPPSQLSALVGVADGKTAYEYSKALLNRWVQHAARDFLVDSIRVNTVSPGPVETPILRDFEASIGSDRIAAAAQLTGRHAHPGEVAAAIRFLLSADASWINGTDLKVDGGYHALRSLQEAA